MRTLGFDPLLAELAGIFEQWYGGPELDMALQKAMSAELWEAWQTLTKKKPAKPPGRAKIRIVDLKQRSARETCLIRTSKRPIARHLRD
jgi:hypothetical protein